MQAMVDAYAQRVHIFTEDLREEVETSNVLGAVISLYDVNESARKQDSCSPGLKLSEFSSAVSIGNSKIQEKEFSSAVSICSHCFIKLPISVDPNLGVSEPLTSMSRSFLSQEWTKSMKKLQSIVPFVPDFLSIKEDTFLVFGGINPLNVTDHVTGGSFFRFKCKERVWQFCGAMPEPRNYHSAAVIGTNIYITGGYSPFERKYGEMLSTVSTFSLCLISGLWNKCADMNSARAGHGIVVLLNKLYVFGGRDNYGRILSSVEFYNLNEDVWTVICNMPEPRMGLVAVSFHGAAWIIGGVTTIDGESDDQNFSILCSVNSYHPESNSWRNRQPISEPRTYCQAAVLGSDLYVLGGAIHKNYKGKMKLASTSLVEVYKSSKQKWLNFDSLSNPRHAASIAGGSYRVYIIGGIKSSEKCACNDVDLLDSVRNLVTEETPFPSCLAGCSAVYIPTTCEDYLENEPFSPEKCSFDGEFIGKNWNARYENSIKQNAESQNAYDSSFLANIPKSEQKSPCRKHDFSDDVSKMKSLNRKKSLIPIPVKSLEDSCYSGRSGNVFRSGIHHTILNKNLDFKDAFTFPKTDPKMGSYFSTNLGHTVSGGKYNWNWEKSKTDLRKTDMKWKLSAPDEISKQSYLKAKDWQRIFDDDKAGTSYMPSSDIQLDFNKISHTQKIEEKPLTFLDKYRIKLLKKDAFEDIRPCTQSTGFDYNAKPCISKSAPIKFFKDIDFPLNVDGKDLFSSKTDEANLYGGYSKSDFREQRDKQKFRCRKYLKDFQNKMLSKEKDYAESYSIFKDMKMQNHKKQSGMSEVYSYCKLNIDPSLGMLSVPVVGHQKEETHFPVTTFLGKISCSNILKDLTLPVILTFGGIDPSKPSNISAGKSMFLYYPLKNCWKFAGLMPLPRNYHGTVLCNQCIFIIGGYNPKKVENGEMLASHSVLVLDLLEKKWQRRRNMENPRASPGVVALEGQIYALGGRNSSGKILDSVEVYNIRKNEWSTCCPMPYPVMGAAVTIVQGLICVAGGVTLVSEKQSITPDVLFYNPSDNSWCFGPPLKYPVAYSGITCESNRVWLFGGLMTSGKTLDSSEIILNLNLVNREWHETSRLSTPRHAAVILTLGSCTYIIGGMSSSKSSPVDKNEIFFSEKQQTKCLAPLPYCLSGMSGAVIPPEAELVYSINSIESMIKKSVDLE